MTVSSDQSDLTHQLEADPPTPDIYKIAPGSQREEDTGGREHRKVTEYSSHEASLPSPVAMSTHTTAVFPPASTEFLLERTLDELVLTPMGDIRGIQITPGIPAQTPRRSPLTSPQ